MRILYNGLLRAPTSWARVGRELLRCLSTLQVEAGALQVKGFLHSETFPLPEGVREVTRNRFPADVELAFAHPGLYDRLKAPRKAGILVYETDRLPPSWIKPVRRHLDLLLLPSEFCRKGAIKAGLPSHMARILPFGVNRAVFHPAEFSPTGPFTFLCVANPHQRKGLRELMRAYKAAFSAHDDTRLVIKTTYDPAERRRRFHWELEGLEKEARRAGLASKNGPLLNFYTETFSDTGLAELYRQAHVYVHPSYGEGFGLALLEAAACGCAPILTGWGAPTEIFNNKVSMHIKYNLISAAPYEYDRHSKGLLARPDVRHLARAMRQVKEDRELLSRLRRSALKTASLYTWEKAGRHLMDYLTELLKHQGK